MMMTNKTKLFATLVLASASILMGCARGPFGVSWQTSQQSGGSGNFGNSFEPAALNILQTNCASCHGATSGPLNVYGLNDPQHMVASGLIVVGQPSQSPIYMALSMGMPPSGPLSSSDIQTIQNWILAMAPFPIPVPAPTPTPGPTPSPSSCTFNGQIIVSGGSVTAYQSATVPAGQTCVSQTRTCTNGSLSGSYGFSVCTVSGAAVRFQDLEATIFVPRCVSCHSATNAAKGYAFDSYAAVMKSVNTATPTSSLVYTITKSGSMPQGGSRLTTTEESQILQWIQAGAPNN